MMKTLLSATLAAAVLFSGQALAEDAKQDTAKPVLLSAAQMDQVTAGVGRDNVAVQPWPALTAAGFVLTHHGAADQGVIDHAGHGGVAVPRRQ